MLCTHAICCVELSFYICLCYIFEHTADTVVRVLFLLCPPVQALAVDNSQPIAAVAGSGGVIAVLGRDDGVSAPLLTRHSSASSLTDLVVIPATPVGALLPLAFNPAAALVKPLKYWPNCPGWLDLTLRMLLPVGVLCVGLGFSIAALSVAIHDMRQG